MRRSLSMAHYQQAIQHQRTLPMRIGSSPTLQSRPDFLRNTANRQVLCLSKPVIREMSLHGRCTRVLCHMAMSTIFPWIILTTFNLRLDWTSGVGRQTCILPPCRPVADLRTHLCPKQGLHRNLHPQFRVSRCITSVSHQHGMPWMAINFWGRDQSIVRGTRIPRPHWQRFQRKT